MVTGERFMTLTQVQEELAISAAQVYALVRRGDLPAIKLGGRGQWRVERSKLEEYITALYADTARFIRENPFPSSGTPDEAPELDEPEDSHP